MSTVLATVAVKKESCFGSSSDRVTSDSSVPVFGETYQINRRILATHATNLEGRDGELRKVGWRAGLGA